MHLLWLTDRLGLFWLINWMINELNNKWWTDWLAQQGKHCACRKRWWVCVHVDCCHTSPHGCLCWPLRLCHLWYDIIIVIYILFCCFYYWIIGLRLNGVQESSHLMARRLWRDRRTARHECGTPRTNSPSLLSAATCGIPWYCWNVYCYCYVFLVVLLFCFYFCFILFFCTKRAFSDVFSSSQLHAFKSNLIVSCLSQVQRTHMHVLEVSYFRLSFSITICLK